MWTKDWDGEKITDPIEPRGREFFLISQQTTKLEMVGYKLAHYVRTTFAIHP